MKKATIISVVLLAIVGAIVATHHSRPQMVEATPVIQLRDRDELIQIYLDSNNEQRFTVIGGDGREKVRLLKLEELRAQLPESADKVGNGLADIWAGM
ncbi:MAG: hypothetical protein AAGH89_03615 [Verrucomicrobiota bacterium]